MSGGDHEACVGVHMQASAGAGMVEQGLLGAALAQCEGYRGKQGRQELSAFRRAEENLLRVANS